MKNLTRITAFFLALILCIGCLASCKTTPDEGKQNDEQLSADNYVANVQIKFATNDEKMKDAAYAMSSNSVVNVYGDNISVVTSSKVNDYSAENRYTLAGGVLYYTRSLSIGENTVSENKKADFAGSDREALVAEITSAVRIDMADFYVVEINQNGELTNYVCSDPFEEAKEDVKNLVAESFESIGAEVTVKNIELQLDTEGERNLSSILSCDYVITMNGVNYEITMRLYTSYDYSAPKEVSAPENADSFVAVPYDEIIK